MTTLLPTLVPEEHHVRALVEEVCQALLGRCPRPALAETPASLQQPHWTACVGVGGAWCGIITVACPVGLVRRGAARILGVAPALVEDNAAQDLLAELANVIGGNLKGAMASILGQACHLALPMVTPGDLLFPGARRVRQLRFACDEEVFEVNVLETAVLQTQVWETREGSPGSPGGPGEREP